MSKRKAIPSVSAKQPSPAKSPSGLDGRNRERKTNRRSPGDKPLAVLSIRIDPKVKAELIKVATDGETTPAALAELALRKYLVMGTGKGAK
jgi:hypothetical protein